MRLRENHNLKTIIHTLRGRTERHKASTPMCANQAISEGIAALHLFLTWLDRFLQSDSNRSMRPCQLERLKHNLARNMLGQVVVFRPQIRNPNDIQVGNDGMPGLIIDSDSSACCSMSQNKIRYSSTSSRQVLASTTSLPNFLPQFLFL